MPLSAPLEQRDLSHDFKRKISSEEIASLPICHYTGNIVLVRTGEELASIVAELQKEEVLGFDTETRPVFTRGKSHPPALVQIASANAVYIIQLAHLPMSETLATLFSSRSTLKVGVAVHDDLKELQKLYSFAAEGFLDLSKIAKHNGLETHGLRNMAANFFGVRISKSMRCSNWASKVLNKKQLIYAATDAYIGREIYLRMKERGFKFP